MTVILSMTHMLAILLVLGLASCLLLSGRRSLLALTVIGFIFITSLGLVFAPYLPLENIAYLTNPIFLINDGDIDLYLRQLQAHWIFIFLAFCGLLVELSWPKGTSYVFTNQARLRFWGIIFFALGLLFSFEYFVLGPGMDLLLSSRIVFSSTIEAVAARSIVRDTVQLGQGAYAASLASKIIFPLAAALLLLSRAKRRYFWFALCFLLSAAYAFQTIQKAPLLAVLLTFSLLLAGDRYMQNRLWHNLDRRHIKKVALITLLVSYVGGTIYYMINFGQSVVAAIQAVFARLLVIPGATETNYFYVFPDIYFFRGIDRILLINLGHFPVLDDITIFDVAVAATGDRFSSNASFLAVAWSGAGFWGVALASIILVGVLIALDRFLLSVDNRVYIVLVALTVQSFLGLSSGSLLDYIHWGGFIIPLAILIVVYISRKTRQISRDKFISNMR